MSDVLPETTSKARLRQVVAALPGTLAIAVSGGVDSLTLAAFVCAERPSGVRLHHAVSPAVPPEATARTRALAARRGWDLAILDAGEFDDPDYMANPTNRCFFCKRSLYGAVVRLLPRDTLVLSGTNTDDLGEYRPGLDAAAERGVRHPFVEAGIDKRGVRALARSLGLGEVADLPASPCLSSRIETGIPIDPATLRTVHAVETLVRAEFSPRTVRCRVRASGIVLELDAATLAALGADGTRQLRARVASVTGRAPALAPYRTGSAFLGANTGAAS